MKKALIRTCSLSVLSLYMVLLFPMHLNVILDYFSLKGMMSTINLEMSVIADGLPTAKDVNTIMVNSGVKVAQTTVIENGDAGTLRAYKGEELEPIGSRIISYIIDGSVDSKYLFGYLSSYQLGYASITLNENKEIEFRIYCQ